MDDLYHQNLNFMRDKRMWAPLPPRTACTLPLEGAGHPLALALLSASLQPSYLLSLQFPGEQPGTWIQLCDAACLHSYAQAWSRQQFVGAAAAQTMSGLSLTPPTRLRIQLSERHGTCSKQRVAEGWRQMGRVGQVGRGV